MKVIHVITGLNDGGAEGALFRLVSASCDDVEHIVVSILCHGKYGQPLQALGVKVVTLNMFGVKAIPGAFYRLYRLLCEEKPDIVQTWMYHADFFGGVAARLSDCKNLFWGIRHANLSPEVNKRSTLVLVRLCSFISNWLPKKIIYCAHESVRAHKLIGYKGDFSVIPNGYDTERFKLDIVAGDKFRDELGLAPTTKLIGFVARWDPQKDHRNLLNAFQQISDLHSDIRCLLVGTGCDHSNLELVDIIKKLNLTDKVILLGRRNDVPVVMNAIEIHVLSSCGEAFPNTVAEAMSAGTPCVATDVGDVAQIIGDTGWVVPAGDSCLLANAIDLALKEMQNDVAWRARSQACAKRIKHEFSMSKMVDAYKKNWLSKC